MKIKLTKEQENKIIETLAVGGEVQIHGERMHLANWKLEKGVRLNVFKGKKELMIFSKFKAAKNFDTFIKSLYKKENNL